MTYNTSKIKNINQITFKLSRPLVAGQSSARSVDTYATVVPTPHPVGSAPQSSALPVAIN